MSIFNIDDNIKAFLTKASLTTSAADAVLAEALMLLHEARAEVAEFRRVREAVQAALAKPE